MINTLEKYIKEFIRTGDSSIFSKENILLNVSIKDIGNFIKKASCFDTQTKNHSFAKLAASLAVRSFRSKTGFTSAISKAKSFSLLRMCLK